MTYRIRAHHGMCFSFFRGEGYNEEFIQNMQTMKEALAENPEVILLCAADDVCARCPNANGSTCVGSPASPSSGKAETYDRQVLACCNLHEGAKMRWNDFAASVQAHILAPGKRAEICGECPWDALCC